MLTKLGRLELPELLEHVAGEGGLAATMRLSSSGGERFFSHFNYYLGVHVFGVASGDLSIYVGEIPYESSLIDRDRSLEDVLLLAGDRWFDDMSPIYEEIVCPPGEYPRAPVERGVLERLI
jgi:hypothetical protein